MRNSFAAYIVVALAAFAFAAPTPQTSRIVLRDNADGGEAQSGASGPANGGSVINSGSGVVVNGFDSGNAGNGGDSSTGNVEGGNSGNRGFDLWFRDDAGAVAQSGDSGPANGGSVVNSAGRIWNAFDSGNAGNGGTSSTGSAQGGDGGDDEEGLFDFGVDAPAGTAQSGDPGPANGGSVRNSGGSVYNIGGSGNAGNGGTSTSGNAIGGAVTRRDQNVVTNWDAFWHLSAFELL